MNRINVNCKLSGFGTSLVLNKGGPTIGNVVVIYDPSVGITHATTFLSVPRHLYQSLLLAGANR